MALLLLVVPLPVARVDAWGGGGMSGGGPSPVLTSAIGPPFLRVCLPRPGAPIQLVEEPPDLLPDLLAAGQPAPARADQSDEPVALVDRHEEALAGPPHPGGE